MFDSVAGTRFNSNSPLYGVVYRHHETETIIIITPDPEDHGGQRRDHRRSNLRSTPKEGREERDFPSIYSQGRRIGSDVPHGGRPRQDHQHS